MFIIHISNLLRMNDIRVSKHISMQYPKANEINIENYEILKRRGGVEVLHRDRYSRVVLPIFGSSHISPDFCNKSQKRNTKFIKYHATKEK